MEDRVGVRNKKKNKEIRERGEAKFLTLRGFLLWKKISKSTSSIDFTTFFFFFCMRSGFYALVKKKKNTAGVRKMNGRRPSFE